MNFEALTSNLFNTEISKIPEPYRARFLKIVTDIQVKLASSTYTGTAGAGLVTVHVDNHGIIKDVDIDEQLLSKIAQGNSFKKELENMMVTAHVDSVTNARKALDTELANLYKEIVELSKDITSGIKA